MDKGQNLKKPSQQSTFCGCPLYFPPPVPLSFPLLRPLMSSTFRLKVRQVFLPFLPNTPEYFLQGRPKLLPKVRGGAIRFEVPDFLV